MEQATSEHGMLQQAKKSVGEAKKSTVRPQQPGETAFKAILPEDVDWKPFPAFPPSVRLATVVGTPSEPAPTRSGSKYRTASS